MARLTRGQIEAVSDPAGLVALMVEAGDELPPALRVKILEAAPGVVAPLLALLQDATLLNRGAPGAGFAPIYAAELLGELRVPEAAEPLLSLLAQTGPEDIIHDVLIQQLQRLGEIVIEPALALYEQSEDPELRYSLRTILAELGVWDERIFVILCRELEENPELGAIHLVSYKDPAALRLLNRAFDRFELEQDRGAFSNRALIELKAAIERLGGQLSPAQEEKFRRGAAPRESARQELLDTLKEKVEKKSRRQGR